jgi:uncharacterized protein with PIN domain
MGTVVVRIYGELRDFLPPVWRRGALICPLKTPTSVKDLIEGLGVPHPEVDLIVVNNEPVPFGYAVGDRDRIAVFPPFVSIDLGGVTRLGPVSQTHPRFVADVHLGRVTAYLRFAGIDVEYRNNYSDHEIVSIAADTDRVLLTRDVGVLKHRLVTRGYFVRQRLPGRQLVEILRRFTLVPVVKPFARCVRCNTELRIVPKDRVERLLPRRTREEYRNFSRCPTCERIYWRGSHYSRMRAFLLVAFEAAAPGSAVPI